jgi:hypothetical protein
VNVLTDALNCGRCGNRCSIGQACNAGVCGPIGDFAADDGRRR